MTQPQKTGTPAAQGKLPTAERVIRYTDLGLTAALFTPSELRALQLICRDADNDVYAKNLLATAIARAESKP